MSNELGKILEIVSDLAVGQKRIEKRLDGIELRLDAVELRLGNLEVRLDSVESRLTSLESDMDIVKTKVTRLESDMVEVKEKLDQVVAHSVMNYDMNKHQNQRLDRLEETTGLSPLVFA